MTDNFDDRITTELQRLVEGTDASEMARARIQQGLHRPRVPHALVVWGSVAAAVAVVAALLVGSPDSGKNERINTAAPGLTSTTNDESGAVTPIPGVPGSVSAAGSTTTTAGRTTTTRRGVVATTTTAVTSKPALHAHIT